MGPKDPKDLGNSMIRAQGHPKCPKLIGPWGRMLAHAGPKLLGEPDDPPPPLRDHEEAPRSTKRRPRTSTAKAIVQAVALGNSKEGPRPTSASKSHGACCRLMKACSLIN